MGKLEMVVGVKQLGPIIMLSPKAEIAKAEEYPLAANIWRYIWRHIKNLKNVD